MAPLKTTRAPITKKDVAFYDRNGYLIVDDILSTKECDEYFQLFESHADENFSALMNLDRQAPEIRAIMKLPRIIETMETLQRWQVDAVMSQFLFKKANTQYQHQAWSPHQDNSYPQVPYPGYITVNIFLENADPQNGGMYMYPCSHRESLLPFLAMTSYREAPGTNPGNIVEVPKEYKRVDLIIKKGAMFVMNGHLIHGSYPNTSKTRSRPLFSISYVSKGMEFLVGKNAKRIRIPVR